MSRELEVPGIFEINVQDLIPPIAGLRPLDEKTVGELMDSMKSNGLLQPIVVKAVDEKQYRLVFGSHRLEAARRLGWKNIPAIVRSVSDEESFLMNVTENLQRNTYVSPIAEARGYRQLISKGWTIGEIGRRIGKSDSYVCNRMRILERLHPNLQKQIEFPRGNSGLTLSHAEHLSTVQDPLRQLELARLVRERNLSLHQLERLTRKTEKKPASRGCLCLCSVCSNKCSLYNRSVLSQSDTNKRLLQRFMDAINRKDFDLFDELCDQDYVWHIYVWHARASTIAHTEVSGLENFKKAVSEFHTSNPDPETSIEDMIAEKNRVAVRYSLIGTNTCPDRERPVRTAVSIYRIADGRIAEEWLLDEEFRWS